MHVEEDETESLLRDSVDTFVREEHALARLRALRPGTPVNDRRMWCKLAAQGWLALRVPEHLGGSGLTARHAGALAHVLGRHLLPEPVATCAVMPAALAARADNPAVWRDVLAALDEGERVYALAWQEDLTTLDTGPTDTVASHDGRGLRVSGTKFGVVGAALADRFLVTARLADCPVLVAVSAHAPGVRHDTLATSDGGSLGTLRFDNAPAEGELLLDGERLVLALRLALEEAILVTAAQLNGLSEAALEITLDYLRTRVQFGRPIGSYQSMQHWAVDLKVQHRLADASYRSALRQLEALSGTASDGAAMSRSALDRACAAVSAAKARASDTALATGRFGVQAHGAIGFAIEADIGLYLRAALRLAALFGNGALHRERFSALYSTAHEEQA
jgi:alkylation response protein AidB-like acyl-CoA dehydrogenase